MTDKTVLETARENLRRQWPAQSSTGQYALRADLEAVRALQLREVQYIWEVVEQLAHQNARLASMVLQLVEKARATGDDPAQLSLNMEDV